LYDPAIRIDLSVRVFNPEVYVGYDGAVRQRAEMGDIWADFNLEAEEYLDYGYAVIVVTREYGRGKSSGIEVSRTTAFLFRLRQTRICEIRAYPDRDRALADLGLEE